jgi:hypothetical protein
MQIIANKANDYAAAVAENEPQYMEGSRSSLLLGCGFLSLGLLLLSTFIFLLKQFLHQLYFFDQECSHDSA